MNWIENPDAKLEGTDLTFREAVEAVKKVIGDYGDAIKKLGDEDGSQEHEADSPQGIQERTKEN